MWEPWEQGTRWRRDVRRRASWQTALSGLSPVSPSGVLVSTHGAYLVFWDLRRVTLKPFFGLRADGDVRALNWWGDSLLLFSTVNSLSALDLHSRTLKWVLDEPLSVAVSPKSAFAWNDQMGRRFFLSE